MPVEPAVAICTHRPMVPCCSWTPLSAESDVVTFPPEEPNESAESELPTLQEMGEVVVPLTEAPVLSVAAFAFPEMSLDVLVEPLVEVVAELNGQ